MRFSKLFAISFFVFIGFSIKAQVTGDTTTVQTFTYESTVRDTVINFPIFNSSSIERVWMRYAMRCKDGLVSPAVTGQTNIGCGEWDYSCNTYITDSTRIDSLSASINNYVVYPQPATNNTYSLNPSFGIYPRIQTAVNNLVINNETNHSFSASSGNSSLLLSSTEFGGKMYVLLDQASLLTAGLTLGSIDALSLFNNGIQTEIKHLRISIKETTITNVDLITLADLNAFQEVFFSDHVFNSGNNKLSFHQPYIWGGNNILLEIQGYGTDSNPSLDLSTINLGYNASFYANDNKYARFIEGNYIDVNNYTGITGNNPRTIETWIKTGTTNKNIAVWGSNTSGKRFTFRVDATGGLRVEINGGYIIGATNVTDDQWHHVAVVFSGSDLNGVTFYIDGQQDGISQISNLAVNTDNTSNVQISKGFFNRYWNGGMDDIRIWSSALNASTIQKYMYRAIDNSHPNFASLEVYYQFDNSSVVEDLSGNNRDGSFQNYPLYGSTYRNDHNHEFKRSQVIPELTLYQGDYTFTTSQTTVNDSIPLEPYLILENQFTPNPGTLQSDISSTVYPLWPDSLIHYNLNGDFLQKVQAPNITTLTNSTINYFTRIPSKIELMSFVTPYGINLDLGEEGKAWYFDVTDYLPILRGSKRMTIERGGEWQEDMDISFEFVHGTPVREVLDLRQIWKVDSRSYTSIMNDTYFAPRTVKLPVGTSEAKVRSAITGHGQQGEFIPRTHYININGGQQTYNWQVWKECADNPVYPQGGTWIYDRAGWCPGEPTDVQQWDVTDYINNNELTIDYGLTTATGTSNYIVNHQIVSYGSPNFNLDGRINEVRAPNDNIVYGRFNPMCSNPVITVENTGTTTIQNLVISYQLNTGGIETYNWNGTLNYLDQIQIEIDAPIDFWSTATSGTNKFKAVITNVNGQSDEYNYNDTIVSTFQIVESIPETFIVKFRTNNAASESSFEVTDRDGAIVFQRSGMANNTTYSDTLTVNPGCYFLNVNDTGDDGLDFWANSDGTGYVRLYSQTGQQLKNFEPDFGKNIHYEFMATNELSIHELDNDPGLNLFPNPTQKNIKIQTGGITYTQWVIMDCSGRIIDQAKIDSGKWDELEIDVHTFDAGMYILKLENLEQKTQATFIKY